ncbi:hypothetical protein HDV05_002718 [Chytridiales sp. JEL 0842]|nr:hypothetical protein HDV05_002718 [Chytridiales sp. JEL 0842]
MGKGKNKPKPSAPPKQDANEEDPNNSKSTSVSFNVDGESAKGKGAPKTTRNNATDDATSPSDGQSPADKPKPSPTPSSKPKQSAMKKSKPANSTDSKPATKPSILTPSSNNTSQISFVGLPEPYTPSSADNPFATPTSAIINPFSSPVSPEAEPVETPKKEKVRGSVSFAVSGNETKPAELVEGRSTQPLKGGDNDASEPPSSSDVDTRPSHISVPISDDQPEPANHISAFNKNGSMTSLGSIPPATEGPKVPFGALLKAHLDSEKAKKATGTEGPAVPEKLMITTITIASPTLNDTIESPTADVHDTSPANSATALKAQQPPSPPPTTTTPPPPSIVPEARQISVPSAPRQLSVPAPAPAPTPTPTPTPKPAPPQNPTIEIPRATTSFALPPSNLNRSNTFTKMPPTPLSSHDRAPSSLSVKSATPSTPGQPQTPNNTPVNPLFAGSTKIHRNSKKKTKSSSAARRMSLGAALCIPPPPRVDNNMNLKKFLALSLGAIGIVYGDIGVSPMFVLRAVFNDILVNQGIQIQGGEAQNPETIRLDELTIIGSLSMLIWIVTLLCSLKYIIFVLRADKNGEGGTWALVSLLPMEHEESKLFKYKKYIFLLGIFGASFLMSDGIIGPAISVLSAFEGVRQYSAGRFSQLGSVGAACGVLFIIIMSQRFGTSKVIKFYSPIMVTWFITIACIGLYNIMGAPSVLRALSPHYCIEFAIKRPQEAYMAISQVVLAVTGAESMYADLGHFKTTPIRTSFLAVVYPALIANYLGQGAFLLQNPTGALNPFFLSVPEPVKYFVLVIATFAAIIASQASISGCFTLVDQAISLRVFPNIKTINTDHESAGAVFIPAFNYALLIGSISLTLIFQDSEQIASLTGIGVMFTMTCTTILYILCMVYTWDEPKWKVMLFAVVFLTLDLMLLGCSLRKIASFGWISCIFAMFFFVIMYTWYVTNTDVNEQLHEQLLEMSELRTHVKTINRTQGTVVFVSNTDEDVPNVLRICAQRLRSLPENIVCMSAISSSAPFIADEERTVFRTVDATAGIYRLVISYGYAERSINTVIAVERARKRGLRIQPDEHVTFVVGREIVASEPKTPLFKKMRLALYNKIGNNTQGKIEYYNLPPTDTLEIGSELIIEEPEPEEVEEASNTDLPTHEKV